MSITPIEDKPIQELLRYCRDNLNEKAIAWATAAGETQLRVVADIKPIQCTIEAVQKLPMLSGYRIKFATPDGGEPNSLITARMDYMAFKTMQNREKQDALFTWVARQLPTCLDTYNSLQECVYIEARSIKSSINYLLVSRQSGPVSIPFLRTEFQFLDYEKPAP